LIRVIEEDELLEYLMRAMRVMRVSKEDVRKIFLIFNHLRFLEFRVFTKFFLILKIPETENESEIFQALQPRSQEFFSTSWNFPIYRKEALGTRLLALYIILLAGAKIRFGMRMSYEKHVDKIRD